MTVALTARQQEILQLIQEAIANTGAPPTRAEIARQLGFKSANAAEEHLQALARKGAIELLSGTSRGIRLKKTSSSINSFKQAVLPIESLQQMLLPLVGRVAAGSPILAQEHVQETYAVAPELFAQKPDYLLKVKGMSMRDVGIRDGDILVVNHNCNCVNGDIVVARVQGESATVKRFFREKDRVRLQPENDLFEPIYVPFDEVEISGKVIGLLRTI